MATLLTFLAMAASVACAIRPLRAGGLVWTGGRAALACLALFVLTGLADSRALRLGLLGDGPLVPWQIVVIFFATAYVSISADRTGLFDLLARHIVALARGHGLGLFAAIYLFSCALTVFTSNDIVILTLTPIIFYLGKHAQLNILPLLFAQYFGANTTSMLLYIGNPTNIILGNALALGFVSFSTIMWLPTAVALLGNLLGLYLYFRLSYSRRFEPVLAGQADVPSWPSAWTSCAILAALLVFLLASEPMGWPIWQVAATFCAIALVKDLTGPRGPSLASVADVGRRMPWDILPFVIAFFVFVAMLRGQGVIDAAAARLATTSQTLFGAVFANGSLAFVLSNLMNNQPMSIFYAALLSSPAFEVSDRARTGAAYAAIAASNLGANFSLIGALAGLMWSSILAEKGVLIDYRSFLRIGVRITVPVFLATLLALFFSLR